MPGVRGRPTRSLTCESAWALLLACALLTPLGCSVSTSAQSSSDSSARSSDSSGHSSDSSASSSASSSPGRKEAQYRDDVRDFTAAYVKSSGRMDEFTRRLGELAKERGITDWEENDATYEGIGRGLGKVKASQIELDTYTANLAGSDAKKALAIKAGYDAEKG